MALQKILHLNAVTCIPQNVSLKRWNFRYNLPVQQSLPIVLKLERNGIDDVTSQKTQECS